MSTVIVPRQIPPIFIEGVAQNGPPAEPAALTPTAEEHSSQVPPPNPEEEEFRDALATLLWRKDLTARPLYDHISAMIRHIYTTQAKSDVWTNKLDLLSRLVKRFNVPPVARDFIKPGYVNPLELPTFRKIRDYFAAFDEEESKRVDHNGPMPGS